MRLLSFSLARSFLNRSNAALSLEECWKFGREAKKKKKRNMLTIARVESRVYNRNTLHAVNQNAVHHDVVSVMDIPLASSGIPSC